MSETDAATPARRRGSARIAPGKPAFNSIVTGAKSRPYNVECPAGGRIGIKAGRVDDDGIIGLAQRRPSPFGIPAVPLGDFPRNGLECDMLAASDQLPVAP